MSWHTLLVLGGIGSGKSQYAESVLGGQVDGGGVRRVPADDLNQLSAALADAKPDETLLVDGLEQLALPGTGEETSAFAAVVRDCPAARLVLVSAEVGLGGGGAPQSGAGGEALSTAPSNAANRQRADVLGALNRTVAATVDAVVLVVAGQAAWLKGAPAPAAPVAAAPTELAGTESPDLSDLRELPTPDEESKTAAAARLAALGPVSLGALAELVGFAAGAQRTATPAAWRQVRVLVLHGDHAGAAAAGAPGSGRRASELRAGTGPLAQLAAPAGASVELVAAATAAAIEAGPATTDEEVEAALGYGWRLAERAADEGVDALVIGAIGDGADTAAAAVTAAAAANSEPASLLARVRAVDGTIDDPAWMRRCAAVRDAVHRAKSGSRTAGRAVLAELGGADLAIATGVLLGAAARRTPVLLDGPVGAAAALVARGLAAPSRHWWLLPDHGQHPTVVRVGEVLGLTPVLDLRLELGEGATALAALPLLNSALELAGTLSPPPAAP